MPSFGYSPKKSSPIDYHEKKLENPFFNKRERIVSLAGLKAKLILFGAIIVAIFLFWFIFFSAFWTIKNITVSGVDQTTTDEINNSVNGQMRLRVGLVLPQNNLLFFSDEKLYSKLKGEYRFQKITVKKRWPNKLEVQIVQKPLACIWNEGDKYYYADTDGYVLQEINSSEIANSKLPLISNLSSQSMSDGKTQTDSQYLNFIDQLYNKLLNLSTGFIVNRFVIDQDTNTVKLLISNGPTISFDSSGDIDKQLNNLLVLKNQQLKDSFAKQKMIDLRFGDKIYYQ